MLPILYDLLQNEGLLLGGSSGINVAGAIRLARQLGPGKTIVTVLCDSGQRYQSKLFNPEFLRAKDLPLPPWLVLSCSSDFFRGRRPPTAFFVSWRSDASRRDGKDLPRAFRDDSATAR